MGGSSNGRALEKKEGGPSPVAKDLLSRPGSARRWRWFGGDAGASAGTPPGGVRLRCFHSPISNDMSRRAGLGPRRRTAVSRGKNDKKADFVTDEKRLQTPLSYNRLSGVERHPALDHLSGPPTRLVTMLSTANIAVAYALSQCSSQASAGLFPPAADAWSAFASSATAFASLGDIHAGTSPPFAAMRPYALTLSRATFMSRILLSPSANLQH